MRLTWRDAVATVLVLAGLTMALSVSQGWDWPLLGGVREGIVALTLAGLAACLLGSPRERFYYTDPFGLFFAVVAVAWLAFAVVGGLITGGQQFLLALAGITTMLWLLGTVRHAVEGNEPAGVKVSRAQPASNKRAFG